MDFEELEKFILENFGGVAVDWPWESEPEYVVFRHGDNRKWFALRYFARKEKLLALKPDDEFLKDYPDGANVEIFGLKVDPEMVQDVVKIPGFLPGYHMNRRYWVAVLANSKVDVARVWALVEMSYSLTAKKYRSRSTVL